MTVFSAAAIVCCMADVWQHSGSFVIKFSPDTNPAAQRFHGRVEHVATGKMIRFGSMDELVVFMRDVMTEVRRNFEQAETLAEEILPPPGT